MKNKVEKEKPKAGKGSKVIPAAKAAVKKKIQKAPQKQRPAQKLKGAEVIYRSLFENMLNGFAYCKMIFDQGKPQDFIYLEVNGAFEALTGLKDVVGKKVSEVIPGIRKTDPELFELYGRVALTGKPERSERYVEALKMWFLISVYSPEQEYFVAVFDVITERKQAEQALKVSEQSLRDAYLTTERQARDLALLNDVRSALAAELDLSTVIRVVVESVAKILGYKQISLYMLEGDNLILQHQVGFDQYIPRIPITDGISGRVIRTGRPILLEDVHADPDFLAAADNIVSEVCVPLMEAGEVVGTLNVESTQGMKLSTTDLNLMIAVAEQVSIAIRRARLYTEATEELALRKKAELELRESEARFRSLSEAAFEGIMIHDRGLILAANHTFAALAGFRNGEELIGKDGLKVLPFSVSSREVIKGNILSGSNEIIEIELIRPDGSSLPVETQGHDLTYLGREARVVAMRDITERKRAEKIIKQQLERLASLRTIDQVVISSFDLRHSLSMILDQVIKELEVDGADVLLLNSTNLFLEYSAGIGFRTKTAESASVRLGQGYAGRVALERQLIQIPNLKDQPDELLLRPQLADEEFMCYFGLPLVAKGILKGVMEIYHRSPLNPDQEWLDFLNTLANQAALAIDNAHLFDTLQRSNIDLTLAYDATIEGWSHAMDLRDSDTEGHTLRVTEMTMQLAGLFGVKDEDLVSIRRGALLHDIGKIGVPDGILLKPAALTEEEWVIMRKHPILAFEMLSPIHYLKSAIDIPYCHHEKWDGTGYPRGLDGELIPLPARIFAIVDVWDALTSDRPYRKAWTKDKALEYLKAQAGKHFDPKILGICFDTGVFDRKGWN